MCIKLIKQLQVFENQLYMTYEGNMQLELGLQQHIPGNFPLFRSGTNLAPIAKAIQGANINPLASIPNRANQSKVKKSHHQSNS